MRNNLERSFKKLVASIKKNDGAAPSKYTSLSSRVPVINLDEEHDQDMVDILLENVPKLFNYIKSGARKKGLTVTVINSTSDMLVKLPPGYVDAKEFDGLYIAGCNVRIVQSKKDRSSYHVLVLCDVGKNPVRLLEEISFSGTGHLKEVAENVLSEIERSVD